MRRILRGSLGLHREQHEGALKSADILHAVIRDAEDRTVGFLILRGLSNPNDSIELMRIVVTKKGRGYGKRALSLIVKWCFEVCHAHRLWLDVRAHNARAQHVYEGQGFVREGVLRECVKVGDTYHTLHVMSILREEYEAGAGQIPAVGLRRDADRSAEEGQKMNHEFTMIKPDERYLDEIRAYRQSFLDAGDEFHGDCALQHFDDPLEWLKYNRSLENHERMESSWITFDQYLYIRKSDEHIVGMINYRRTDDEKLADYAGEIGFSVRPTERNKGYAKAMLKSCLGKCSDRGISSVTLTCNRENMASKKAIIACGGTFERNSTEDENIERYTLRTTN
jgi:predicted acetyltransferase